MKKTIAVVCIGFSFLVSACGGEGDASDIAEELGVASQELVACGIFCPAGTYPTTFLCTTNCDGSCPNAVMCSPIPAAASITATPSVVEVAPGAIGTTRVCWSTQGLNYPVWIRVTANGAPSQLFTKESDPGTACEDAPWILAGGTYEFRIHSQNTDASSVLASVDVNGVASSGGTGGGGSGAAGGTGGSGAGGSASGMGGSGFDDPPVCPRCAIP